MRGQKQLFSHKIIHYQSGEAEKTFQSEPWKQAESSPPWENEDGSTDNEMKKVYKQHRHLILKERKTEGRIKIQYNFPIGDDISVDQMTSHLEEIYDDNEVCFKINVSIGLILKHVELAPTVGRLVVLG